jgi:hypothetical protein
MCKEYDTVENKIYHLRRFVEQPFDTLTIERIEKAIEVLERQKQVVHLQT